MAYLKELHVTYRRRKVNNKYLGKSAASSQMIYELFKWMGRETRERAICLHLNPELKILSYEQVGMGDAMGLTLDFHGIFRGALLAMATSIVLVHNHPHGNPKPSERDKLTFERLRLIGELHNIRMDDFMIIGEEGYFSFEEENLE